MNIPTPQEVADELVGGCRDFTDATDGVDNVDMTPEWLEEFDSLVMNCECCGYWAETDEMDDGICADCSNG